MDNENNQWFNDDDESKTNKKAAPENMSMADRFITAMFLPGEYPSLMKLTMGRIISYLTVLILLVSLIQYGIPMLASIAGHGGVRNYIIEELPEFSFENGKFTLADKLEVKDNDAGVYILVDTSVDKFTEDDVATDMAEVFLVSNTNMLMYNNVMGVGGVVQEQELSKFGDMSFNNESIAKFAPVIYICMIFSFVLLYVLTFIKYLITGFFYALIMYMISKLMTGKATLGVMYKIAIFAQSIGVIVVAVADFIGAPVLMMAGSTFSMLVTVLIMNRAYFKIAPPTTMM